MRNVALLIFIHLFIPKTESLAYDSSGLLFGSLKRRDNIPLHQLGRRIMVGQDDDLLYRRTKDIREDRRFEMTESLLREAKLAENKEALDKYHRELKWLTIDTDEGLGIRI